MIPLLSGRSRVTEVDGTVGRILSAYGNTTLNTDQKMVQIMGPLQSERTLLSAAIGRIKAQSEQQVYDQKRDDAITGFFFLLQGASYNPDETIRNAALNLLAVFDNYGMEIKNEGYTVESSLVVSMLADYAQPEAQTDIALVPQCAVYLAAVQDAQDEFESIYTTYGETVGEENALQNASEIKEQVLAIVNKMLVLYLNVMAQIDDATYGAYARTMEEIISENNEAVKRRRTSGEPE